MNSLRETVDWAKGDGLAPAIVQHATTGRILMLGYMNAEALSKTQSSKRVTFFSRSRQQLWTKGDTSGNQLEVRGIELDCDADTLLVQAIPSGPTCHRGTASCFDQTTEQAGFGFIGQLEEIIDDRIKNRPDDSYTAKLVASGIQRIAQKIGEEGVEVALAAVRGNQLDIVAESADLIFHLLVLLNERGIRFASVVETLQDRHRSEGQR